MKPGAIAFTRMPMGASSLAADLSHPDHGGLGRPVNDLAGVPVGADDRRDVDDRARPSAAHEPGGGLHVADQRDRVDREGVVDARLGDHPQQRVVKDPGVVDEDVEPAIRREDIPEHRLDRLRVALIGVRSEALRPVALGQLGGQCLGDRPARFDR